LLACTRCFRGTVALHLLVLLEWSRISHGAPFILAGLELLEASMPYGV
jgi:hypothetical protein